MLWTNAQIIEALEILKDAAEDKGKAVDLDEAISMIEECDSCDALEDCKIWVEENI